MVAVMRLLNPLLVCLALGSAVEAGPLDDIAKLDILPGWRSGPDSHTAALRITLAPGWHTYWRAPGDAGIPPQFSWGGSENITGTTLHWPVPEVFTINGLRSIGYSEQVIIPVTFSTAPGPARLKGEVMLGVCEDICVPVLLTFDAELPATGARDPAILAALMDKPEDDVGSASCAAAPSDDGLQVTTSIALPSTGSTEVVVIETGDPAIWVSEADSSRSGEVLTATVDMVQIDGASLMLDRSALRITVLGSDRAVDIQGCEAG
jgi:DsbC/DsbD-like thiol-disulfide interchange protein